MSIADASGSDQVNKFSASVDFGIQLDLEEIASKIQNSKLIAESNEFVEIQFEKPKGTAQIFRDGKTKIVEMNNENDMIIIANRVQSILKKIGCNVQIQKCSLDK